MLTVEDFRRLPLTPTPVHIQPDRDHTLVNMPTIVWADPTPQDLTTTLLGVTVHVHATPTTYTWDFADTTPPVTTTTPGHPWPDADITHTYTTTDTHQITLTTRWTGHYRTQADPTWHDITGTATTTTLTPPIHTTTAHTHLVADTCTTTPTPPGC